MATILTFSTSGSLRRAEPRHDAPAEVIVFPRTEVGALRRLSDVGVEVLARSERPAAVPGDDGAA